MENMLIRQFTLNFKSNKKTNQMLEAFGLFDLLIRAVA